MLDTIIIAVIGIMTWRGIWRGLIREVFGLGIILIAFAAAGRIAGFVAEHARTILFGADFPHPIALATVFIAVLILFSLLNRFIRKKMDETKFGKYEHAAGGAVGFLKGLFLITVLLMAMSGWDVTQRVVDRSTLGPPCMYLARGLALILPDALKERLNLRGVDTDHSAP